MTTFIAEKLVLKTNYISLKEVFKIKERWKAINQLNTTKKTKKDFRKGLQDVSKSPQRIN